MKEKHLLEYSEYLFFIALKKTNNFEQAEDLVSETLISALIRKPKLLILDEPFVGLDPKASYLVKETMKELCSNGTSIFFSTHVLEVAEKLCDKIAIIKNGEIIATGTVEDVKGNKSLEDVFLELANE